MDNAHWSFHIARCLGRGGFGEVYQAEMTSPTGIVTPIALKVLRHDILTPGNALARLRDEAKMLARLEHRAILTVHDLVVIEGRVALVTELVEGIDLEVALFGSQRIGLRAASGVLEQVASALEAACNAPVGEGGLPLRLVHRDIKPSNIRLGRYGSVKLLDFGIARTDEMAREARTRTDTLLGSPPYMAPERFGGEPPRPAADLYALGAIALEAALGERLFAVPMAMLASLSLEPARFRSFLESRLALLPSDIPRDYRAFALRLLSFDPTARPTAAEAVDTFGELSEALTGPSLARWCRETITAERLEGPHEHGELEGRVVTATVHGISTEQRHRQTPSPAAASATVAIPMSRSWMRPTTTNPQQGARGTGTAFFGRTEERAALAAAWYEGVPLLTVHGPAGVGKTRLVNEHLSALPSLQPDVESALVSLIGLSTLTDLLAAVATALQLPLTGRSEEEQLQTLGRALRHRAPFMLVLDNAEPFAAIVAHAVSRWIAPGLQILVTSRKALQLESGRVMELNPLPPDDALELLLDRARRVRWDYSPSQAESEVLRELARTELDGLPLALELAGARLDVLDPAELVEGLRSRIGLLSGGRGASQWSSVTAALQSSWRLLNKEEQHALSYLSVFISRFERSAAESVMEGSVIELLRSLVDHSLLQRDGSRFYLLDTVRVFAREQLELTGESNRIQERHRRWFAHRVIQMLAAAEQGASMQFQQLDERNNLLAAHANALEACDIDAAVPLACWLDKLAQIYGPLHRRAERLEATIALLPKGHPAAVELRWRLGDALRAELHTERARAVLIEALEEGRAHNRTSEAWTALFALYAETNEIAQMRAHLDEALAAVRGAGDRRREGLLSVNLSFAERSAGQITRAEALVRRAVKLFQEVGDVQLEVAGLLSLASFLPPAGDERLDLMARALALARTHKLALLESNALTNLAVLRARRGEWTAAIETCDRAIPLKRRLGDRKGEQIIAQARAEVLMDLGRFDEAALQLEAIACDVGALSQEEKSWMNVMRGMLERARGRLNDAEMLLRTAMGEACPQEGGVTSVFAYTKIQFAVVLAELGRTDEAQSMLDGLETFYRDGGDNTGQSMLVVASAQIALSRGAPPDAIETMLAPLDSSDQEIGRMIRMLRATMTLTTAAAADPS